MTVNSPRHRYVYARTWLIVLLPVTIGFAIALMICVGILVTGFFHADGEKIIVGAFGAVGASLLLLIVATQCRRTWKDAKTAKAQRRKR
jgi:hypothetical protein